MCQWMILKYIDDNSLSPPLIIKYFNCKGFYEAEENYKNVMELFRFLRMKNIKMMYHFDNYDYNDIFYCIYFNLNDIKHFI